MRSILDTIRVGNYYDVNLVKERYCQVVGLTNKTITLRDINDDNYLLKIKRNEAFIRMGPIRITDKFLYYIGFVKCTPEEGVNDTVAYKYESFEGDTLKDIIYYYPNSNVAEVNNECFISHVKYVNELQDVINKEYEGFHKYELIKFKENLKNNL